MELIAIGTSAFLPGFALAGVRTILVRDANDAIAHARGTAPESIIIMEEDLLRDVTPQDLAWIETSPGPVIIAIDADDQEQERRLRRAIRSTLGVDLLEHKEGAA